jgi:putative transposon-encoded protein
VAEERKSSKTLLNNGDNRSETEDNSSPPPAQGSRVKFEIFGEEMIEKRVKASGNSGRVYLPPDWVGHKVKIIRID